MLQSWNNGIVERWNSEFSKEIIHFKLYHQTGFCHLSNIAVSSASHRLYGPEAKTHYSAKAALRAQYSSIALKLHFVPTIPIGAKPRT